MPIQTNMTQSAIEEQMSAFANNNGAKKNNVQSTYDKNRYFNLELGPNETERNLRIRLLPINPTAATPFMSILAHNVPCKSASGKKYTKPYVCPTVMDETADCPFCRKSKEAYAMADKLKKELAAIKTQSGGVTDMATENRYTEMIKMYEDMGKDNLRKTKYIVRLIDRDHEGDGVKFWMFDHSVKSTGYLDSLNTLYNMEQRMGRCPNIYDVNTGCDINVNIRRGGDGKKAISFVAFAPSPLSQSDEQAWNWVNDQQTWDKMWTVKPYDYLEILSKGGTPKYDKTVGRYVDKDEMEAATRNQSFAEATQVGYQPQYQPQYQQPHQQQYQPQYQQQQPQYQQPYQQYQPYQQNSQTQIDEIIGGLNGQIVE